MRSYNILIVEDLKEHQDIIKESLFGLKKPKINPIIIGDGEAAYKYMKVKFNINLFILDIKLPSLSGEALLRNLRTTDVYKNVPIIVLTSSSSLVDKKRCSDFNVNVYIEKPSDFCSKNLSILKDSVLEYYKIWLKKGW